MFDIGWNELLVIAMVAIVVIGPKDLPRVMRTVGQWVRRLKRMGSEFQGQFNEALREAELDDVRKGVEDLKSLNPLNSVRDELTKAGDDIKKGMEVGPPPTGVSASTAASSPEPAPLEAAPASEPAPAGETPTPVEVTPTIEAPKPAPVEAVVPPAEPAAAAVGEVKP